MANLTRVQYKNQDRIKAWLRNEPFKESSRDKDPQVPKLALEDVLNQYIPVSSLDRGAYYTPVEMVEYLLGRVALQYEDRIWEPCCGIGNLVYGLKEFGFENIFATELDQEAAEIFPQLFPEVEFRHADAFDLLLENEGKFDAVVMNPPFNLPQNRYFTVGAEAVCRSGATKSQHYFLELALRAVKPGGCVIAVAPYNYIDGMPAKMKPWFESQVECVSNMDQLPGEFAATQIRVCGFIIDKKYEEPAQKIEIPAYALKVPSYVYEALLKIQENKHRVAPRYDSTTSVIKSLKFLRCKDAAKWIEDNSLMWGNAFFNGVVCGENYIELR